MECSIATRAHNMIGEIYALYTFAFCDRYIFNCPQVKNIKAHRTKFMSFAKTTNITTFSKGE